jgi:hypothetical protein
MQGFISLHRKLMENPIWGDPNYLKLWIYCLFKASHQEHDQLIGNQVIKLERGQFPTGRFSLTEDMNKGVKPKQRLDDLTWWRYLKNLEKMGMLNIKTTNKFSVVTIDKYDFYQSVFNKGEQQTEQQMNNKRTTDEQQMNTNNNGNKGNKGNKKDYRHKRVYDEASIYYKLASMLYEGILKNMPDKKKPDMNQWADDFRKLVELDGKEPKHVETVIKWTQDNDFWWKNVLSADKFRKQYERLAAEVRADMTKHKKLKSIEEHEDYQEERKVVSSFDGRLF